MHATTEQLLSLRDGEPVAAAVAEHVCGCDRCCQRLDALQAMRAELRGLPLLSPDPRLWESVTARAQSDTGQRLHIGWWAAAGLAAVVVLAVLLTVGPGTERDPEPRRTVGPPPAAPQVHTDARTVALIRQSRRLEAALRVLPPAPSVVRVSTAGTIAELRGRIARVDYQLVHAAGATGLTPSQSQRLWQQRVDLMNSLVRVHYAQVRADDF